MALRDLVIVGAGGHGRELLDLIEARNSMTPTWRFVGFLDDGTPDAGRLAARGARHLGPVDAAAELPRATAVVVGIGDGAARALVDARCTELGLEPVTLVHPAAVVGSANRLGPGCVVFPGACITTGVTLGRQTHLNVGVAVQHDSAVGDFVTLSPGTLVNGDCVVGDHVFTGSGAVVTRGCTIGAGARIGAGAVVLGDVAPGALVVGAPARSPR